jgi:hypothetical protein
MYSANIDYCHIENSKHCHKLAHSNPIGSCQQGLKRQGDAEKVMGRTLASPQLPGRFLFSFLDFDHHHHF